MKILLHIGSPKTGTTTLQRTLYASRDTLADRGILYPKSLLHKYKQQELVAGFGDMARNSSAREFGQSKLAEIREAYFQQLKREVD